MWHFSRYALPVCEIFNIFCHNSALLMFWYHATVLLSSYCFIHMIDIVRTVSWKWFEFEEHFHFSLFRARCTFPIATVNWRDCWKIRWEETVKLLWLLQSGNSFILNTIDFMLSISKWFSTIPGCQPRQGSQGKVREFTSPL